MICILIIYENTFIHADRTCHTCHKCSNARTLAQYEREGGGQPDMTILTIFSLTLYITISAIFGVVGYSIWKVFSIRRKAAKLRVK